MARTVRDVYGAPADGVTIELDPPAPVAPTLLGRLPQLVTFDNLEPGRNTAVGDTPHGRTTEASVLVEADSATLLFVNLPVFEYR